MLHVDATSAFFENSCEFTEFRNSIDADTATAENGLAKVWNTYLHPRPPGSDSLLRVSQYTASRASSAELVVRRWSFASVRAGVIE